jgi:fructose-bisphosphate aldolase class I
LCQEANLVPIVEPEILMDGDHGIERHAEVTERALHAVFEALAFHRVRLEAMLLKPNMVVAGSTCPQQATVEAAAAQTLATMRRGVPAAVPGLVFLSGGQDDIRATEHLNALNKIGRAPWEMSFSFGRALQAPVLRAWGGRPQNSAAGHEALMHRARCNSAARFGQYSADMELLE